MTENEYQSIEKKLSGFPFHSMNYLDYEDLKDSNILINDESVILATYTHDGMPQLHWAAKSVANLLAKVSGYRPLYMEFIPEQWQYDFEAAGFSIFSEWIDYFLHDLKHSENKADTSSIQFLEPGEEAEAHLVSMECRNQSRGFLGEEPEFFLNWKKEENGNVIVVRNEGKIAGFCCVSTYGEKEKKTLWIREIAVRPAFQKIGLCRCMLSQAIGYGIKLGACKAFLAADAENDRAIRCYQKAGFMPREGRGQINMVRK